MYFLIYDRVKTIIDFGMSKETYIMHSNLQVLVLFWIDFVISKETDAFKSSSASACFFVGNPSLNLSFWKASEFPHIILLFFSSIQFFSAKRNKNKNKKTF